MLKSWYIENFKSAKDRVELSLAPLTIFSGANSSGKSTVLQSILLAKQTFQHSHSDRPLALNGPILKLGRFDDIKHVNSIETYIGLGGTFDVQFSPFVEDELQQENRAYSYWRRNAEGIYSTISFETRLDVTSDDSTQLQPALAHGAISGVLCPETDDGPNVDFPPHNASSPHIHISIAPHSYAPAEAQLPPDQTPKIPPKEFIGKPRYKVTSIDSRTRAEVLEGRPKARIVGAMAHHFLPSTVTVEFDANAVRASRIAEAVCSLSPSPLRGKAREIEHDKVPHEAIETIFAHLESAGVAVSQQLSIFEAKSERDMTVREAISFIQQMLIGPQNARMLRREQMASMQAYRVTLQEIQSTVQAKIAAKLGAKIDVGLQMSEHLSNILSFTHTFFAQNVGYIGPLRNEPKPLYPLEALSAPLDVGYRGEHTAAVLELNKERQIRYLPPSTLEDRVSSPTCVQRPLHDAVVDWLSYLGVAEDVKTSDLGKFGHEMQVIAHGLSKSHDLTNVGVGVSQVLPIVVMALLAEDRNLLIFEQPELHLHPKVQSRLGDFFLLLSMQGKQCIVETHSEYLIQRIRRRIAESEGVKLRDQSKIYFVERDGGQSKYTQIAISEFGTITDWPRDFFDQGDYEIEKIIEASHKKQIRSRKLNLD